MASPAPLSPFWISPDGHIAARAHRGDALALTVHFRVRSPGERAFLLGKVGELQFSERSTLARIGIEVLVTHPPVLETDRLVLEAEAYALGPNFPCAPYFAELLQVGVPVGRLYHAPAENRLSSGEIWDALRENRIKLPNTIAIDRHGRVSFTPHRVEYTLPSRLLRSDHERLVRGELPRGFLDTMQVRRNIDIVSIPPKTGLLTSCSMYLQEHYVVLNRGPGNFGLHSGAVLLDPIRTWGTNVMLEIYNTGDSVVVNPVVSMEVYRAPGRHDESERQGRRRRLAIRRDLQALYAAAAREPVREAPEVRPRTAASFRGRTADIDNPSLVVRWDEAVRGASRRRATVGAYRNVVQALAKADEGADTLVCEWFPSLFEHIEILARLRDLNLRRIVFRTPSRHHGFFFSTEAHARLDAYGQMGIEVYWNNTEMDDLFIHMRKKDHGFFVREEMLRRFQASTIFAFYGSALDVSVETKERLRHLIQTLTGFFGPRVGVMTGGGGGVMGLAAEEARRQGHLTGACFLELEAQPPEFGVDFFNTFQSTARHNRQKWFEVADFCIFNTGGVGTLEEIGIELCNLKLGIRPRVPYVFFSDGYWDDLKHQLHAMFRHRRAPSWMKDYLLFTNDPDEVLALYRRTLEIL